MPEVKFGAPGELSDLYQVDGILSILDNNLSLGFKGVGNFNNT